MSLSKIKLTNSCTPSHQTYKISFQECCNTNLSTKNSEFIRAPVYFRTFKFQLITRLRLLFSNGQASSLNFKNKIEEALVKPILGIIITSSIIYILKLILKRLDHPVKQFNICITRIDVHNLINLWSRS